MSSTTHQKSKEDAKKSQSIDELLSEISHFILDNKSPSKSLVPYLEKKFEQLKSFSSSESDKNQLDNLLTIIKTYPHSFEKPNTKKEIFGILRLFRERNPPITYTPPILIPPKKEASPKSLLSDVGQGNYFRLKGGEDLKNVKELADAFKTMSMEVYGHHTSSGRNDFSTWIYDLFGNKELADELKTSKNKGEAYEIVNRWINKDIAEEGKEIRECAPLFIVSNSLEGTLLNKTVDIPAAIELDLIADLLNIPMNSNNHNSIDGIRLSGLKKFYTELSNQKYSGLEKKLKGKSEKELATLISKNIAKKGLKAIKSKDYRGPMRFFASLCFKWILKNNLIKNNLGQFNNKHYLSLLFLDVISDDKLVISKYLAYFLPKIDEGNGEMVKKILIESSKLVGYKFNKEIEKQDEKFIADHKFLLNTYDYLRGPIESAISSDFSKLEYVLKKAKEITFYIAKYGELEKEKVIKIKLEGIDEEFKMMIEKEQLKEKEKIKQNLELAQKIYEKASNILNKEKLNDKTTFVNIRTKYEMASWGLDAVKDLSGMVSSLETILEKCEILENKEIKNTALELKNGINAKISYLNGCIAKRDEILKYVSEIKEFALKLKQPKLVMKLILSIKNEEQKIIEYETRIKELRTQDGALLEPTFALFDEKIKDHRTNFTNMQKGILNKLVEKYSILMKLTSSKEDLSSLEDVNESTVRYLAKSEKVLANIRGFAQLLCAQEISEFKEFIEKIENETTKSQQDLLYLKDRLQDKQKITDCIDAIINEKNTIRHIFSNDVTLDGIKAVSTCKENLEKKREEIAKYSANKCLKTILGGYKIACDDLDKATKDAMENGFDILKKYLKDPLLGVNTSMVHEMNPIARQSKLINSRRKRLGEISGLLKEFSKSNINIQNESEEIKAKEEQLDKLSFDLQEILKYNADIKESISHSEELTRKIPAVFTWLPLDLRENDNVAAFRIANAIKNYRSISEKYKNNEEMTDALKMSEADLNKIETNLNKFANYAALKCSNKYLKIKNCFEKNKTPKNIEKLETCIKELEQIRIFYSILEIEKPQQTQIKGLMSQIRATIYEWYKPRLEKMEAKELGEIAKKYGVLENGK